MVDDLEYLDFVTVKEDWTLFKLEDETVLKSRFILGSVLKKRGIEGEYSLNTHVHTVAIVPKKLWGSPSSTEATRQELIASVEREDMKFTCLTPDMWNVYRLRDGFTVSVRLELVTVSRTTRYTEKGERVYTFNIQPIIKLKRTEKV